MDTTSSTDTATWSPATAKSPTACPWASTPAGITTSAKAAPELALGAKLARLPAELRGPVTDKAVSPAFQEVLTDRWNGFRKAVKAGEKASTDAQVVGFLDSGMLDGPAAKVPELQLKSSAITSFCCRYASARPLLQETLR